MVVPKCSACLPAIISTRICLRSDGRLRRLGGRRSNAQYSRRSNMGAFGWPRIARGCVGADLEWLVGAQKLGEQKGASLLIPVPDLASRPCIANLRRPDGRSMCPLVHARRVARTPWRSPYPFSVISPSCSNATLCKRQKPSSSSGVCNVPPAPCPAPATRTGTLDCLPPLEYGKGLNSRQVDRTRGGGMEQWSVRKASFPEML